MLFRKKAHSPILITFISFYSHTNLTASITKAEKLLLEINAVKQKCDTMENENFSDFNEEFMVSVKTKCTPKKYPLQFFILELSLETN
jgi:hypothetical protein